MLRMSNLKDYKYDLYWEKEAPTNVLQLKKRFGIEKELTYFEIAKERIDGSCNLFNKIV